MSEALGRAVWERDRVAAKDLVAAVLRDALEHGDRYGYDTRKIASTVILELELVDVAAILRQLAAMPYTPPDYSHEDTPEERALSHHDLLDFTAISDALWNLSMLGDPAAESLNLSRLGTPGLRARAIDNLRRLNAWNATARVREAAGKISPTKSAFMDLRAAISFLALSPELDPDDCQLIARIRSAYPQCFDTNWTGPGIEGCEEMVSGSTRLQNRLRCQATAAPASQVLVGVLSHWLPGA